MNENPETTTESANAGPIAHGHRDHRLHRVLAWVGIVAGVVFTVAVVFFSGFALGRSSGYHGWNRGYHSQMGPGRDGGCPMMRNGMMGPGSMMGPGPMMGPGGMDPDDMGPGMMRPGPSPVPSPSSSAPGPAPR